ncbi:T. brucei spp.-specific protein [Trypanosoma brucei gambiense DAL972]|uniref:T. brucei spp.-specific protein n=2 Tax=Trypanosoma brucei TaxID=5691 RepID=C9ZLV4_TRYB9|nr:T. brucei spp.-specific protein [Trypanosoma brucei gambiense DAL972]RHW72905.1 hypothetical protein DPX39_040012500 [Trypanosoma brucei equiperdum]CBH10379.1 T. brucei spp.-specific protein [Trypanosoma brucei gambiense DAL972]|eukprot:XP_011772669.1 T. brucei spp.-specific protein [Trypanosoma brucei gambiense DAL972]
MRSSDLFYLKSFFFFSTFLKPCASFQYFLLQHANKFTCCRPPPPQLLFIILFPPFPYCYVLLLFVSAPSLSHVVSTLNILTSLLFSFFLKTF